MLTFNLEWFFPFLQGIFFGLMAMALHEIGHLLLAQALGLKVKKIGFCWKGIYTVREAGPPAKNALVSFAGPLVNLALIPLWLFSPTFGLANLCCAVVNLLPIQGSDGKRILKCLREIHEARLLAR